MKKISYVAAFILALIVFTANAQAAKAIPPINNQEPQTVGGADSTSEIRILRTDANGRILTVDDSGSAGTFTSGVVTVAETATVMPTLATHSCLLQAKITNAGAIYVGDATVTNAGGAKEGIMLQPGWSYSDRKVANLNEIYVVADEANDVVKYSCK